MIRWKTISKKLKTEGIAKSLVYYFLRFCSKAFMKTIGYFTAGRPVNPGRIVFKNRERQDFTDNARAMFEFLVNNGYNQKYEIIYMVSDRKKFRNMHYQNVKFITAESRNGWTSPLAYYYGATARYFFYTNHSADLNRYHGKGQVTVNLWHGCGYKDAAGASSRTAGASTMTFFDYAVVPGPVFVDTKSAYWNCEKKKLLPFGYPRYDWMLDPQNKKKEILHLLFGDSWENCKVIIWMPTFRKSILDDYAENNICLPYELPAVENLQQVDQMDHWCRKNNVFLIIKNHPLQIGWADKKKIYTNIRYISDSLLEEKQILLYRLISVCDALISDYSSVAVDYLLLDRPLGFVLTDYEQYKNTRGFIFEDPLEYMPGAKIYNFDDLLEFIQQTANDIDPWKNKRKELLPLMHNRCTGCCRTLAEFLEIV